MEEDEEGTTPVEGVVEVVATTTATDLATAIAKSWSSARIVTGASGVAYGTVKDAILRHIQSYYDGGFDIAKSLRDGTKLDLSSSEPRRDISRESDEATRLIEQDGFNIKFELRYKEWMERSQKLDDGMKQSYAFIFDNYCNKTIQDRIE